VSLNRGGQAAGILDIVKTSYVTLRELVRNTAEVLDRVAAGERVEITRNGQSVAVMTAPDPAELTMKAFVKAGVFPKDWQERQANLKAWLGDNAALPAEPDRPALSELLEEDRESELR
jgi:prevent-host-death family protein